MFNVRIQVPSGFKDISRIVAEEFKLAMNKSTSEIEQEAKGIAPYKTGNLRRAITSDVIPLAGIVTGTVYPNMKQAPYAEAVEQGTGIYSEAPGASKERITPKTKKALAFMLNRGASRPTTPEGWSNAVKNGEAMVVKSIAGMRAKPYMRPAFEKAKSIVSKNFEQAEHRIKERMKG